LNKADTLDSTFRLFVAKRYPEAIFISAKLQDNLDGLLQRAQEMIFHTEILKLHIPYDNTALVAKLHELAKIHVEDYRDDAVYLEITISAEDRHLIKDYIE
jgi:GTP-binding protein HflX